VQRSVPPKRINLALQGGGAHGAYAWGVLDRLLEDERIEIEAISGTSAGAINAVVVAEGLVEGGRKRAREQLAEFWRAISNDALASPVRRSFFDVAFSRWNLDHNPALFVYDMWTHMVSPYQFNPFNINPLRALLEREIDFDRVRACSDVQLFISATNVHNGQIKVFTGHDITIDAVMASACLPYIFQAVEIDGTPYWDGGYLGNPVIFPFFDHCRSSDVLLVQINPFYRPETPKTAREILDRINEISFNASLVQELSHVDFVNQCLRDGTLTGSGYREIFVHRVGGGPEFGQLSASSKLNAEWDFLTHLHQLGYAQAGDWLDQNFEALGRRGTLDLGQFRTHRLARRVLAQPSSRSE
jgi:NTE family protein